MTIYILLTAMAFCQSYLMAAPAEIIFIRHGEKPHDEHNSNLSMRGYIRSYALVSLFVNMPLVNCGSLPKDVIYQGEQPMLPSLYSQPVALYGKAQKKTDSAVRSLMTLEQIAHHLSLSVTPYTVEHDECDKENPKKYEHCYMPFMQEILDNRTYDGKTVLIAWEHNAIPTLMQALLTLCSQGVELHDNLKNPKLFKKFDRIIRFTLKKGIVKTVDDNAQALLYDDSAQSTSKSYKVKGKKMIETKK